MKHIFQVIVCLFTLIISKGDIMTSLITELKNKCNCENTQKNQYVTIQDIRVIYQLSFIAINNMIKDKMLHLSVIVLGLAHYHFSDLFFNPNTKVEDYKY